MPKNQFKDNVNYSAYLQICNKNLKLLRQIDKLNNENLKINNEKLELNKENLILIEEIKNLNNLIDNFHIDLNKLEADYKALNKPLKIDLELTNFSISTIVILLILFISLSSNFITLKKHKKTQ